MAESQKTLFTRAATGDRDALGELLEQFSDQVARRVNGRIGRQWTAVLDTDDIMQVTFLEAFLRMDTLQASNAASFSAWLGRIAENNLRDAIRGLKSEKRPQPFQRVPVRSWQDSLAGALDGLAGSTTTASRKASRRELEQIVEAVLEKLPADYATVIRFYYIQEQSAVAIGERMGRSRGAIHMLRARALERLRELIGSESSFFSDV